MSEQVIEGGCRCGAVRYRLRGLPLFTLHCHCADCRRSAGGPVQTWISYPKDQVSYAAGEPNRYQSSPGVWRGFCAACGTPPVYEATRIPDEVHILVGTLDSHIALAPERHVWWEEKVPWLDFDDDLPRYARFSRGDAKPIA